MSFGDQQFLYRLWTMDLQNAGDTGGRMTPMRYYNYSNVIGWLDALGELDPRGEHHLYLAVRYFSQTPETDDVRRLMEFVERDVARSPATKWFWLTQALVIAEKRLRDLPYALQISERLATLNPADAPNWVFMMPAILMEKMGRLPAAESAIRQVRAQRGQGMRTDELLFIDSFIQRLHGSPG